MNDQTVWNLTEFSELEERVLSPYEISKVKRSQYEIVSATKKLVGIAVTATAITMSLGITGIELNDQSFRSPISSVYVAQSGIEQRPPLEEMFAGRFDGEWSTELENMLLETVESNRKELTTAELREQAVDSIFYNQQEGVSGEEERLSREEVEIIVKERKIV